MPHRVTTWNVNGLRAREASFHEVWGRLAPTILCLQETKALPAEIPESIRTLGGVWSAWNGNARGYSGVGILVRQDAGLPEPAFEVPPFDHENRSLVARFDDRVIACLYMPNGNKADGYAPKLAFYDQLIGWVAAERAAGHKVWLTGDFNIAHTSLDLHPKLAAELDADTDIGTRDEERLRIDRLLGHGLVDVQRRFEPLRDDLFTWWPYWRQARERNRGWRIDLHLVAPAFGDLQAIEVTTEKTGSDHAPVTVTAAW